MREQPATELGVAEVEAVLAEVLARPDYLPVPPSLLQRWLVGGLGWFREVIWSRVAGLLPTPDWSSPAWAALGTIALAVGAILGLALIAYLVLLLVRAYRRRRRAASAGEVGEAERPLTAAEWEARSREAADRGAWRDAALALYHAVLVRLNEADLLAVNGSKTPGDYRREAHRAGHALAGRLDVFLTWFEHLAYGRGGDGAAEFDRLTRAAAELRSVA